MRIGKTASGAEYRMNKQFQNLSILWILIVVKIEKIQKFGNFQIWKILCEHCNSRTRTEILKLSIFDNSIIHPS